MSERYLVSNEQLNDIVGYVLKRQSSKVAVIIRDIRTHQEVGHSKNELARDVEILQSINKGHIPQEHAEESIEPPKEE